MTDIQMIPKTLSPASTLTQSSPQPDNKLQVKYAYTKFKGQKPKRNKSAFILFSQEARVTLKGFDELNSNQIMVRLAELWKDLPEDQKTSYNVRAKNDRDRYKAEMTDFLKAHPNETLHNKTKNNHVKKPCSSYALYLKARRSYFKENHPEYKMAEVLKHVSQEWKNLDSKTKAVYQKQAEQQKSELQNKICETFGEQRKLNIVLSKNQRKRKSKKDNKSEEATPSESGNSLKHEIESIEDTLVKKRLTNTKIEVKNEDTGVSTSSQSPASSYVKAEEPLTVREEINLSGANLTQPLIASGFGFTAGQLYNRKALELMALHARQNQFNTMLMQILKIHASLGCNQNTTLSEFYAKMMKAAANLQEQVKKTAASTEIAVEPENKIKIEESLLQHAKLLAAAKANI